jgi:hypothetical protein
MTGKGDTLSELAFIYAGERACPDRSRRHHGLSHACRSRNPYHSFRYLSGPSSVVVSPAGTLPGRRFKTGRSSSEEESDEESGLALHSLCSVERTHERPDFIALDALRFHIANVGIMVRGASAAEVFQQFEYGMLRNSGHPASCIYRRTFD